MARINKTLLDTKWNQPKTTLKNTLTSSDYEMQGQISNVLRDTMDILDKNKLYNSVPFVLNQDLLNQFGVFGTSRTNSRNRQSFNLP
jgi:hypothetical protein